MSKHRKRWTIEEKEEILLYYKDHGIGKASTNLMYPQYLYISGTKNSMVIKLIQRVHGQINN